jgi:hypothetical protein
MPVSCSNVLTSLGLRPAQQLSNLRYVTILHRYCQVSSDTRRYHQSSRWTVCAQEGRRYYRSITWYHIDIMWYGVI